MGYKDISEAISNKCIPLKFDFEKENTTENYTEDT